jgi:hypothetical protein
MKKNICFSMLLIPVLGFTQQWRPVTTTEKFNYRIDTASYISNVICVDSITVQNDSIFCLNRIVTSCPGFGTSKKLYNQPQFLERKMVRKAGGVYMFKDPGEFWLRTLAELNAPWVFDSVANITAQVTAKTSETILNQLDSVKTITLSNGKIIKLSKNHGIIQFPLMGTNHFYLLEGIAGRNLGILIPQAPEFFNFNVGDVFQYKDDWMSDGLGFGGISLVKKTVLSRDSSSEGFTYNMIISGMQWSVDINGIPWDTSHFYYFATEVYDDSATHECNLNPNELARNPGDSMSAPNLASDMKIFPDTGQSTSRLAGTDNGFPPDEDPIYSYGGTDTLVSADFFYFTDKYTTGLGRVKYDYMVFEIKSKVDLIGYVKNGDTTGIVYPDGFLLQGIPAKSNNDRIKVFPNPAGEKITVEIYGKFDKSTICIMNLDGRELMKQTISGHTATFDITGLPKGVYIVKLTGGKTMQVRKIIKD